MAITSIVVCSRETVCTIHEDRSFEGWVHIKTPLLSLVLTVITLDTTVEI